MTLTVSGRGSCTALAVAPRAIGRQASPPPLSPPPEALAALSARPLEPGLTPPRPRLTRLLPPGGFPFSVLSASAADASLLCSKLRPRKQINLSKRGAPIVG